VYAEASIRPQGRQRDGALAAAGKLLGTSDPAGKLRALFDKAAAKGSPGVTWERDFAPWLGEQAGVWVTGLERHEPSFAVVVQSTDQKAAAAALGRLDKADGGTRTQHSYHGVDYVVDDGVAHGLLDDFVVLGTEDAFKRTVDTRDGDPLADSERYKKAIDTLEDDRLGHYYVDPKPLLAAALKHDPSAARQYDQFKGFLAVDQLGPITGAFTADGKGMALDTVLTKLPDGPLRKLAQFWSGKSDVLPQLPGDAWGAFATPKLGDALESLVSSFGGAIGGAAITAQVQGATGLNLQQDVFAWMGDLGAFVRGSTKTTVDGGLVIQSTDDAKAATAFGKVVGLIGKQSATSVKPVRVAGAESAFAIPTDNAAGGKPLILARGKGRVVATYGEAAAREALAPKSQLGDSQDYSRAKDLLSDGMEPGFLLSMPSVLKLIEATRGGADSDYQEARPYLQTLGVISAGGKVDGDRVQSRVAVGFK
jgi:hypothetical protein